VSQQPNHLVERMREFETSIFAEMTGLAMSTGSINLGQGFPDYDGPQAVLDAAAEAIRGGHNQYPPSVGILPLREAIAAHEKKYYDLDYDPSSEIVVTTGATEGLAAALLALTETGDEVIVFEPYFDVYAAGIGLSGARRVAVTLHRDGTDPSGWSLDPAELEAAVTPRTKLILLNSPHNPTGKVFTREELQAVADVAIRHDLIVLSDEVYEHLVFDGLTHTPIATHPGMHARTIKLSSAGKTFSVTGWKVGWACAPKPLASAVLGVKQHLSFASGHPFQVALAKGLAGDLDETRRQLQAQRDVLCDGLAVLGYDVIRPQATYFTVVDVKSDALEFARALPARAGVVTIPMLSFYDSSVGDTFVRFAFCKRPDVLQQAVDRLRDAK
jgi:N-succinyldiaminopimelate aminotransferase